MSLLTVVLVTAGVLITAYLTYGRWLCRALELRSDAVTPACQLEDGVDFVPTPAPYLFSQHFSAIAAAGPIVGPITAGLLFGWLPAWLWILVGSVLIGGVHDIASLVASVRHQARSIAEIVHEHMSRRAYLLFLSFVWIALVYIVVAFTDLTATAFAPAPPAPLAAGATEVEQAAHAVRLNDVETGKAVASSSMMYLLLAVAMGLLLRFARLPLGWATAIFMPLVLVSIWAGEKAPLAIPEAWLYNGSASKTWDILLLIYCGAASVVPVWALLQPRGFLGGYFLTATVALAFFGIVAAALMGALGMELPVAEGQTVNLAVQYPAFRGASDEGFAGALGAYDGAHKFQWMFPVLFVTIACGACSGFHSMISSGTSSKQLRAETDAKSVGYGAMLLEAFVAVVALGCVMIMTDGERGNPDAVFAKGVAKFIGLLGYALGIPYETAYSYLLKFALLAFATFIYDTLDVCTRLGRFVLQEFTGWKGATGRLACTVLTLAPPMYMVLQTLTVHNAVTGAVEAAPAWKVFWVLFGTANQLLAALTLIGVTVWLARTGKKWLYAALPAVFMVGVTFTSLGMILWSWVGRVGDVLRAAAERPTVSESVTGLLTLLLFCLALCLVVEACVVVSRVLKARAIEA